MPAKKFLLYISQNYSFAILRPLQAAILARGDEVKWFVKGNDVNMSYFDENELRLATVDDIFNYQPDAIFVPGNLVPSFLPGLKVAVFHGFNVEKRSDSRGHFNIRGCFDMYCTQGPNTTGPFQSLADEHKFFSVAETGWPAIDPLYDFVPTEQAKPTILLCSTFSKQLTCAPHLFEQVKQLSASGRWNWLVQFHPKMEKAIVEQYKSIQSEHLTFVETDNVLPLLQKADVMVCDTSSVLLMFLLLSKPVVTFKNSNSKNYLIDFDVPSELEAHIETALSKPDELMQNIEYFREQTHPYTDGKSAHRVLAAVDERLSGVNNPVKSKPLNFIREMKMRKSLGYWKFWS
ncbi:CDP-glycerol glycerophosphotransferase family protein [Thalassotalea euphylliae]|uniref:CDP-glycerol glycerophosphotransferase family protein n=1 Tax=Thalassotalea euphylliae TaxID=1655234 RepID=UPI003639CCC3